MQVLFEKLKLDTLVDRGTKFARTAVGNQKSTSEAVLNQLQDVHPLPKLVLQHRQVPAESYPTVLSILTICSLFALFR